MKAVILAGGRGSRLAEETSTRPKPMVEIGGRPILWHIMKIYSHHDINDFVVCLGYRGYMIKEYFANYFLHLSNVTIDLGDNSTEVHESYSEPWRVTLVDTGIETETGGRLRRVASHVSGTFAFTYGDGVGDVDITKLIDFHREQGRHATVTAVQPPGRFGHLEIGSEGVRDFVEKPTGDGGWVNGGFFVLEPEVLDYVDGDDSIWEQEPMRGLAADGQLAAYQHHGFWHPMDTLRDRDRLESLWAQGDAPWKVWR